VSVNACCGTDIIQGAYTPILKFAGEIAYVVTHASLADDNRKFPGQLRACISI
jgi:hypothetical protein